MKYFHEEDEKYAQEKDKNKNFEFLYSKIRKHITRNDVLILAKDIVVRSH